MLLPILSLLLLLSPALAAPSPPALVYSIASQFPPAARPNHTWSFTLLPGTFNASSGSTISLSSRDLPAWARFDAATATFSGLPSKADVGRTFVQVQANASGNAVGLLDGFELLVVDAISPFVKLSLANQLPSAANMLGDGATLSPDGAVQIPPSWSFSLGFQQYSFSDTNSNKIYYGAYETGTTSLPYWLQFDNETVTFGGVTPYAMGETSVTVFGSEYYGYGDISETFKISVGFHTFTLVGGLAALNTTPSDRIEYVVPLDGLRINNVNVSMDNLTSIAVDLSSHTYLSYNTTTRTIAGTIPSTLAPSNTIIPIVFTDKYNDTLNVHLSLNVFAALFTSSTLPQLDVVVGTPFKEDLSPYITSREANYSLVVSPSSASSWITFNPKTFLLSGTPPTTASSTSPSLRRRSNQIVSLKFVAIDPRSSLTSSSTLQLSIAPAVAPIVPVAPADTSSGLSASGKLALALSLGLILGLAFLILLFLVCRYYWSDNTEERRMRRDGSTLIFNDETLAAAEVSARTGKPLEAVLSEQREKGAKAEKEASRGWGRSRESVEGRKNMEGDSRAMEDAAAVSAEVGEAKKWGFMGLFQNGGKKSGGVVPISENSLFGLGIGEQAKLKDGRSIVVVTDRSTDVGVGPSTYVPQSGSRMATIRDDEMANAGSNDSIDRSSSWDSGGSSSLFYSEGSGDEGRRVRNAPRQRRDFLPLPPLRAAERSSPLREDIRLVDGPEGSEEESGGSGGEQLAASPILIHRDEIITFPSPSAPRLIPFTKARTASETPSDPTRYSSHRALQSHDNNVGNRNSAIEDAYEEGDKNRRSATYIPPRSSSPTTSAVIFSNTPSTGFQSPTFSEYDAPTSGVRLVSSTGTSPFMYEGPSHHRRTLTSSSYNADEPIRMSILTTKPFRFTPRFNPPPFVSVSGGPSRSTYYAYLDSPTNDRDPLPSWIHFDPRGLEVSGLPTLSDIGEVSLVFVERKAPGSPTRGGKSEGGEVVVGRYCIEVEEEEGGEMMVITY